MLDMDPEPDPDGGDSVALNEPGIIALNEPGIIEVEEFEDEKMEVAMHSSIVRSSKFHKLLKRVQGLNNAFHNIAEGHGDETKTALLKRGVAGALIGNAVGAAVYLVVLTLVYVVHNNLEDTTIHRIALFAIPVIWNIAQYASYSIQLTGHFWPSQHLKAIVAVGGHILGGNLIGVCFAFAWLFGFGAPLWLEFVVILLPLVMGLAGKTWSKLNFIRARDRDKKGNNQCPFTNIDSGVFWTEFRAPFVCMIWTMLFAVGLQAFVHIVDEDNALYEVWLIFCYVLTLGLLYFGLYLLKKHVVRCAETPSFTYNLPIVLVFYYVYGLMVSGQIRLILINFSGGMRLALGIFHPIQNLVRRLILMRQYKKLLKQARYAARISSKTDDEEERDREVTYSHYGRMKTTGMKSLSEGVVMLLQKEGKTAAFAIVVAITASMLTDDIAAGTGVALACTLGKRPDFNLGSCETVGLTILTDLVPLYIIDFLETLWHAFHKMPVLFFFQQLDWFIVVAAVAVGLLNAALLIWASSVHF